MLSDYPGKMPDWVKRTFVLGIVIAVLHTIGFFGALLCSQELLPYFHVLQLQYIQYTAIPGKSIHVRLLQ